MRLVLVSGLSGSGKSIALDVLEDSLLEFTGALVFVTHDRWLLDRVSTRLLALDGAGRAEWFADYAQWEAVQERKATEQRSVRISEERSALGKPSKRKGLSYKEQTANVDEIAEICQQIGVKYVIGDAGGGAIANSRLRDILSPHRVGQSQYGGGGQGVKLIRWSPQANRFLVNRTAVIDTYILALKNQEVIFPNVRQMAVPIQDILNVYEERVMSGLSERRIWTHAPTAPDDCLHAQVYAWLAMKIVRGEVELFYEMRDTEWQVA